MLWRSTISLNLSDDCFPAGSYAAVGPLLDLRTSGVAVMLACCAGWMDTGSQARLGLPGFTTVSFLVFYSQIALIDSKKKTPRSHHNVII